MGEAMRRKAIQYRDAAELVSNMSKQDVDAYAASVAEVLKLEPGAELEPLIESLGGRIQYESPFDGLEDEGTVFVHGPHDFDIVLSSVASERRDRFTIAHELGHYLLHSHLGAFPLVAARRGGGRAEWEANWFAAGLLMPAAQFAEVLEKVPSLSGVADHFLVSFAAAEVRKKSLKL